MQSDEDPNTFPQEPSTKNVYALHSLAFSKTQNCSFSFSSYARKKKGANITKDVSVRTTANKKGELSEANRTNTGEKPNADRPIPIIRKTLQRGSCSIGLVLCIYIKAHKYSTNVTVQSI